MLAFGGGNKSVPKQRYPSQIADTANGKKTNEDGIRIRNESEMNIIRLTFP